MIKILFVDDEIDMLKQAEIILSKEDEDFEIETAISGEEALDLLSKYDFDIIISDYKMPVMNGVELLKEIRDRGIKIPFIILTAAGDEGVAMDALNYGADRYIQKKGRIKEQFEIIAKEIQQEIKHSKVQRELIKSERKYKDLVKNLPVGIYKTTPEGKIINGNEEFAEILGYSDMQELRLKDASDLFFNPDDRKKWMKKMKEEGILENFEYKIKKPDGEIRWVKDTARAVKNDEGVIDHFSGIISDVTEIKNIEEELGQSKEWLSLTFNILDSIADLIITTDNKGRIAFINNSTERLLDIKKDKVVGDDFDQHFQLFSNEDGTKIDDPIGKILNDKNFDLRDEILEIGTENSRETILCTGTTIEKKSGNIIGTILTIKEMKNVPTIKETPSKKGDLEDIYDDLPFGVILLNAEDYTPIKCNKTAIEYLGFSSEKEIKDTSLFSWSINKEDSLDYNKVEAQMNKQGKFSTRVIKRYQNGGERILSFKMKKIIENSEERILLSIFDISKEVEEMKRINQKSNKYRKVFNSINEGVVVGRVIEDNTGKSIDITVLDVNSAFQDLMGIERGRILGKKWSDILFKLDDDYLKKISSAIKYSSSESFKLVDSKTNRKIDVKVVSEKDDRVILIFKKPYS